MADRTGVPLVPDSPAVSPTKWERAKVFLLNCFSGRSGETVGRSLVDSAEARIAKPIWENKKLEAEVRAKMAELDEERQRLEKERLRVQVEKTRAETVEIQSKALLTLAQAIEKFKELGLEVIVDPKYPLGLGVQKLQTTDTDSDSPKPSLPTRGET